MAARKLQQEMEKTFKKVAEGRETFQQIYDKITDCDNPSQKEKLEDQLKREIKKLQRHRDQIKTWAASNEIKDKKPLLEQRKLIETEMEKFKAVEKEMKTKAFSKEGLSQSAKLDPKEREKADAGDFLTEQIEDLGRQIETLEAEEESLNATVKKGKKDTSRADRLSEIAKIIERHRWHQSQLELVNRALENGSVDADQINGIKEDIKYYVQENQAVEFIEDDTIYDDLALDEEGGAWGIANEVDRVPSNEDNEEAIVEVAPTTQKSKSKSTAGSDAGAVSARRPSNNFKSPLPSLATLHAPSGSTTSAGSSSAMKPAPPPTRPAGETLQYASAAKTAATNERTIAPLPPPPGISPSISALPGAPSSKPASVASPLPSSVTPIPSSAQPAPKSGQQPAAAAAAAAAGASSIPPTPVLDKSDTATPPPAPAAPITASSSTAAAQQKARASPAPRTRTQPAASISPEPEQPATPPPPAASDDQRGGGPQIEGEEESIYHLPPGLQELIQSFEMTRCTPADPASEQVQRMLTMSSRSLPDAVDTEKPRSYKPSHKYNTPRYYPQEPESIVDDPALFNRIDTDTLFFLFYYRQGTYLQYAAARALKQQSWRFHKQYQTWFQRHEEPKLISDEFEQGTYRFFDYESTWMNRRKADFKFAYKFLEDDL